MPPLHFEIGQRRARPPRHGDAVARHLARAGRAGVQPVGVPGGEDHGAAEHHLVFAGDHVEREHAADRPVRAPQQRGDGGFLQTRDSGPDDLLAPQIHERHARIALGVCGDAADLAGTGDDVALVVAPQIKTGFLEFRVVDVLDPLSAAARPVLIDQELVVVLDQELGGVAGLLLAVAEPAARDHQVAGEHRCAALADQALADDDAPDALALQVERGIAAGRATSNHHDIRRQHLHPAAPALLMVARRHWRRWAFFCTMLCPGGPDEVGYRVAA